eukprot:CAMPEP_0172516810 /NCGR_PEP_ID=MMETSP1066-20121228/279289_1 /TAXON_ID=671091 /ORGANISM="Coscinodiscus wailesii, Strain CCMP2513" /LENGTH=195 /DNA_ID=CAMNT_0013298449 /DNA_START=48 /DNA_END=631 /DNA_ORIENTATION=-
MSTINTKNAKGDYYESSPPPPIIPRTPLKPKTSDNKICSLLFGSVPNSLFEKIDEIIDDAVTEGVSSLPFLEAFMKPKKQQHQHKIDDSTDMTSLNSSSSFPAAVQYTLGATDASICFTIGTDQSYLGADEHKQGIYGGGERLRKELKNVYDDNFAKVKDLAMTNCFSLASLPKAKRKKVLGLFAGGMAEEPGAA